MAVVGDGALARYAAVGLLNTAVGYGLILFLQFEADFSARAANLVGFGVGWSVSYMLTRCVVFRHQRAHGPALALFALGAGLCWCLNAATLHVALRFEWHGSIAQAAAVLSYTISFYLWNRYVAFPDK